MRDVAQEELSAVSTVGRRLKSEVLPLLEELEQAGDRDSEDYDEQVESIAIRLQRMATALAPPRLADKVMDRYPTPISLAYRRFHYATQGCFRGCCVLRLQYRVG